MANNDGLYIKNDYLYKEGVGRIHKATDSEKAQYGGGSTSSTPTGNATGSAGSTANPSSDPDAGLSIAEYGAKHGVSIPSGGSSSSGSYKVTGIDRPARTGYLRSAKELADLYDINYDMNAIRSLYDDATNAKYALLSKELEQAENDFYTNNANANATLLDTLKKATSSAIATGASRGIAGAEKLGLMMEAQQGLVEETTNMAQERANMADEIATEKAENIIKALEYSDSLKTTLGNLSSNVYSADTQYDAALLEWAWQNRNIEALFEQIAAEKDTNAAAQALQRELALLEDARIKDEGAKDRASNEKIAADNAAAQQAYYDYMMKNAGSGGSGYGYGGYGNQPIEGDDWDKIWNKGDRNQAIKYLREHWGMTWQEANDKLNGDKQFLMNEKYRGYDNIPKVNNYEPTTDLKTLLNNLGLPTVSLKSSSQFSQKATQGADEIFATGTRSPAARTEKYKNADLETKKAYDALYNGGKQFGPH